MDEFLYKEEGYKIIGCFYAVYNTLGPGFLESVYQEALTIEFEKNYIPYVREQKIEVFYGEDKLKKYFKADFICYNEIIIEVKSQKPALSVRKEYPRAENNKVEPMIDDNSVSEEREIPTSPIATMRVEAPVENKPIEAKIIKPLPKKQVSISNLL